MTTEAIDRLAWLEERRTGVGASDVAGIMGISPWESPWSIWASKVGLVPLDDRDGASLSMQLGLELEPVIARRFHLETGLTVAGEQTLVRHRRAAHHLATVDGFVLDGEESSVADALGILECKYTAEAWDELPEHYVVQVQWQLHCSGLAHGWVAALQFPFGRPRFGIFEVERDKRRIDELVAAVDRFWFDHVVTGVAPPADEHDATTAAIAAAWGHLGTMKVPTLDFDEQREVVAELADLRARRSALKPLIEHRENVIKAAFGAADETGEAQLSEGVIDGELAVSWRSQGHSKFELDKFRSEHADLAEQYTTRRPIRVLRTHGRYLR